MRTVVDPEGRKWRVRRVWFTRSARWRGPFRPSRVLDVLDATDALDLFDFPGIGAAIVFVVLGAVFAALAVFFVLPAVAFLIELAVVVVIMLATLCGRFLLRKPWLVVAEPKHGDSAFVRGVVGFRAAGREVDVVARMVERGEHAVRWTDGGARRLGSPDGPASDPYRR